MFNPPQKISRQRQETTTNQRVPNLSSTLLQLLVDDRGVGDMLGGVHLQGMACITIAILLLVIAVSFDCGFGVDPERDHPHLQTVIHPR